MDQSSGQIMVVEDEQILLDAIIKKMQLHGISPLGYSSGNEALKYLNSDQPKPVAIWLDFNLTDMDGLEFMRQLKTNPILTQIPIIVVSNSGETDKVNNMLALGVKQYLLKAEHRLDELVTIVAGVKSVPNSTTPAQSS